MLLDSYDIFLEFNIKKMRGLIDRGKLIFLSKLITVVR